MPNAISLSSLRKIPLAYASCSLGAHPSDTLPRKLEAISNAGFTAIELSFPDIVAYAKSTVNEMVGEENYPELCKAAQEIARICKSLNLEIMMLQPFANFEGWPMGSSERERAFSRARGWIQLMRACGTDLLQVGSTDSDHEKLTSNRNDIIRDLRELADMLAKENFRMAYENWCWATHAPTWKDVWEIVRDVDRPNVGLCLDTFQTAGSEWGDPPSKIYLLQISDAYKPKTPLERKVIRGLRPRGRWSHDYRPFPYEGGYLPVEDVAKAVLKTGFRGYFSMEVFDSGPEGKGKDYDMQQFAKDGMQSMQRLFKNVAETD